MMFNIYDSAGKFQAATTCKDAEIALKFAKSSGIFAPMVQEVDLKGRLVFPKPINYKEWRDEQMD